MGTKDQEYEVVMAVYEQLRKIKSEPARKTIMKYVWDRIRNEEDVDGKL